MRLKKTYTLSFILKKEINPTLKSFSLFYFSLLFRIIVNKFNLIFYQNEKVLKSLPNTQKNEITFLIFSESRNYQRLKENHI